MQTIKLDALSRWHKAVKGELISLGSTSDVRRVRLHVNSNGPSQVYMVEEWGLRFLAKVDGYNTVEFYTAGEVDLMIDAPGDDAWWHCAEIEPTCIEVKDPTIFTEIAGRRQRNPELEEMMFRMQMNVERRMAMQRDEYEAQMQRYREEVENARAQAKVNATGSTAGTGATEVRASDSAGNAGSGAQGGSPAAGGTAGGTGSGAGAPGGAS